MNKGTITIIAMIAFWLLVFTLSCGGRKGNHVSRSLNTGTAVNVNTQQSPSQTALSDEDTRVMTMSDDERLRYLKLKYRELVFQFHSIIIDVDENITLKASSSTVEEEHVVVGDDNVLPPPDRDPPEDWHDQETVIEYINLQRDGNNWLWNLSFLERVYGDYDFNGVVGVSDLTPIAMHYGHTRNSEWFDNFDRITNIQDLTPLAMYFGADPTMGASWLQAPYNIDRSANCDSVINVADITPLAMNYGIELTGYNVYWQDSSQAADGSSDSSGQWKIISY